MQRWWIRVASTGSSCRAAVEEYVGHTIAGSAYAFQPPGARARAARQMRATIANGRSGMRRERIGRQKIVSLPFGDLVPEAKGPVRHPFRPPTHHTTTGKEQPSG